MKSFDVTIKSPRGNAGDTVRVEAATAATAEKRALAVDTGVDARPGWVVTAIVEV